MSFRIPHQLRKYFSGSGAGDTATPYMPHMGQELQRITVTLSLDTSAYAAADVLADTQAIANAVRENGGSGELVAVAVHDDDDQGVAMDLIFLKTNVSLGTENAAASISDADAKQIQAVAKIVTGDYTDVGGAQVAYKTFSPPLPLCADTASRSIFLGAITRGGTPTHTASGLTVDLWIKKN